MASPPRATAKPPPAPVTPNVPPQLVACGERDFYRITRSSLEAFEIAAQLPPPQIRGNRIAQKTTEVSAGEPLNVFVAAKKNVVVVAKDGVFRYELGQKEARRYAPIPTSAPLVAWPDARRADSFVVRSVGDDKLRQYSLAGLPSVDPASPPAQALVARHSEDLEGFDARLFTLLADKTRIYSTPKGLVRGGNDAHPSPFPELPGPATILFADSAPARYWAGDASGRLALWDPKQGASPLFTASVPGVVIDAAQEGDRVAVLSVQLDSRGYLPTVTIFSNGKEVGRMNTGPSITRQQPLLDVCLVAGRPWVVVGSRLWLQLLDWESRRLLAEW